eukprot:scaffold142524_cov17-Tisochrysis_lutea.AAC.1
MSHTMLSARFLNFSHECLQAYSACEVGEDQVAVLSPIIKARSLGHLVPTKALEHPDPKQALRVRGDIVCVRAFVYLFGLCCAVRVYAPVHVSFCIPLPWPQSVIGSSCLVLRKDQSGHCHPCLPAVMRAWLPLSEAVLGMAMMHLPAPPAAAPLRMPRLLGSSLSNQQLLAPSRLKVQVRPAGKCLVRVQGQCLDRLKASVLGRASSVSCQGMCKANVLTGSRPVSQGVQIQCLVRSGQRVMRNEDLASECNWIVNSPVLGSQA